MKRVQVADLRQALLKPQASPVDAYEQAGAPDPSQGLQGLAKSLAKVQPSINRFLENTSKSDQEEARLRAQRDRLKNKVTFAEGVKEGVISEGENPFYVKAYKRLDGKLAGQQEYTQLVSAAYQESGLAYKEFATPEERSAALADFLQVQREKFLKGHNDPYWVDGASSGIYQAEAQFNQRYMQDVATVNKERATVTMQKQIGQFLFEDAPMEARGAAIADFIKQNAGHFGLSFAEQNKTVLRTITTEAKALALSGRYQDAAELLKVVNHVETRDGATLGDTAEGRKTIADTMASIQQVQRNNDNYAWSLESREYARQSQQWAEISRSKQMQDWATEDALVEAYAWIGNNPTGDFEAKLQELQQKDSRIAKYSTQLRNAYQNRIRADRVVFEAKPLITSLQSRINKGVDVSEELATLHDQGEISTDTFYKMMGEAARVKKAGSLVKNLDKDAQDLIEDQRKYLEREAKGQAMQGGIFRVEGIENARNVNRMYRAAVIDFLSKNPGASYGEVDQFLTDVVKRLKQHDIFTKSSGFSTTELNPSPVLPPAKAPAKDPALSPSKNPFDNM